MATKGKEEIARKSPAHDELETQISNIINDMFKIMMITSNYDTSGGRPSQQVLSESLNDLSSLLRALPTTANLPSVPPELISYVEEGRNPDIYTREFLELVHRANQLMRGKMHAFGQFRDILAEQIAQSMPECRADVDMVVEMTGGRGVGGPTPNMEES